MAAKPKRTLPLSPRQTATQVLKRVLEEGAYVNLALSTTLDRAVGMSAQDKGFLTELVYGTLRHLPILDLAIAQACGRPLKKVDVALLHLARVAAYEALILQGADHALVNEAVEAARRIRDEGAAKFLNGLLRGLLRVRDAGSLTPPTSMDVQGIHARTGVPAWLVEDVARRLSMTDADAFGKASLTRPVVHLCVPRAGERPGVLEALKAAASEAQPHPWCVTSVVMGSGAGAVETTLETVGIHALVQNTASQAVAQWAALLATEKGPRVLDLCAAPGGKSAVLAAQGFQVVSGDIHVDKLHLAQRQWKRLSVQPRAVALDGRVPPFADGCFDVVVLDAPCSGTGLLNRRPDIKLRTTQEDLARLTPLQSSLLDSAARMVRPGGSLLYSVCSVTSAEGPAQVRAFLQRTPGFTLVPCPLSVPPGAVEDGMLALWPQRHETDGFFAAHLARA